MKITTLKLHLHVRELSGLPFPLSDNSNVLKWGNNRS